MKEILSTDLDADTLMKLIDGGERFYVTTESSSVLSQGHPNRRRDAFWFEEAPCASKPVRGVVEEREEVDTY